jgi:hypothetical protein
MTSLPLDRRVFGERRLQSDRRSWGKRRWCKRRESGPHFDGQEWMLILVDVEQRCATGPRRGGDRRVIDKRRGIDRRGTLAEHIQDALWRIEHVALSRDLDEVFRPDVDAALARLCLARDRLETRKTP